MKITDTTGRVMQIDMVTKQGSRIGWLTPLDFQVEGLHSAFLRMPHGPVALRVMTRNGADILMFVDGKKVAESTLPGGVQYIERDLSGKPLSFSPAGAEPVAEQTTELTVEGPQSEPSEQTALSVPRGHGVVLVIARFAPEAGPGPCPPREEYPFLFEMNAPDDHDKLLAKNLRRVVAPPPLPNFDDIFDSKESNRPRFVCPCTGCQRK